MNTTKLHIIAKNLHNELVRCETVNVTKEIVDSLQQIISQPQQPTFQTNLSTHLTNLYQKLNNSPVNEYSPAWRDAMEEFCVSTEFGDALAEKIKNIFERNEITQQVALDELQIIHESIKGTETNLKNLIDGLEYFGVGEDELESEECEIGLIVPRKYVGNNMKNFGKELIELEKTLIVFSELSTGSREPLQIRNISSSELSVFLQYIPEIGACIAIAVERIVALYKQMLEIKKLKAELLLQNIPDESLSGIDDHANSIVSPKLDEIANELLETYGKHISKSRKNEISVELRHSLNKLANRIDRGLNIELRVAHIPNDEDDEGEPTETPIAIQQIINSAKNIEFMEQSGEPVLFLPENDIETDDKSKDNM